MMVTTVDASSSSATDDAIELPPGFRFHPTDEEILTHYLSQKIVDSTFTATAIGHVDFNKCEPWDLPKRAKMGEKEWYFFCQKDRKYPTGMRTNRATEAGYWKATGKDKEIYKQGRDNNRNLVLVGMKKTLVFYTGRAPKGEKTNWVMHEYRLDHGNLLHLSYQNNKTAAKKDEWVVCRVFHKTTGVKKSPLLISDNHHHHLLRINSFRDDFFDSPLLHMHMPPLLDHPSSPYLLSGNNSRPPIIDNINNNNSYNVDRFPAKIMATTDDDGRHFYSRNMYEIDDYSNNFFSSTNNYMPLPLPLPASQNQNQNPLFSFQASLINSGYLHHQQMNNSLVLLGPDDSQLRQCKVEQYSSNQSALSISQDTGLSTDINTTEISSKHDMGRSISRPYEDLEGGPSSSEGPVVDLECLWNY